MDGTVLEGNKKEMGDKDTGSQIGLLDELSNARSRLSLFIWWWQSSKFVPDSVILSPTTIEFSKSASSDELTILVLELEVDLCLV
jgi:hypothetical protein